jgi:hypothetical protein
MQALGLVWGEVDSRAPDYRERTTFIGGPKHPGARLTLTVWRQAMAADGFVIGRDVPSRKLSSVLRNLAVYEPVDGGRDFHVRIAGTAFYRRFGYDITGKTVSGLFGPDSFAEKRDILNRMIESGTPVFAELERAQGTRMPMRFEVLLLPVLAPRRAAGWVMTGIFFQDWVS